MTDHTDYAFWTFMLLLFFLYASVMTLTGKIPQPFELPFVTFLVLVLWGLEFFRCFSKVSEEMRVKEKEGAAGGKAR